MARPSAPLCRIQSTSTVGFPRESRTSLALISRICMLDILHKNHSCGSAVCALEVQRKGNHLITARRYPAQIQSFNDNDVTRQQYEMRRMFLGFVGIDRKIVDSNQPNPLLNQKLRGIR